MIALVLTLMLSMQGTPAVPQGGTVTGVLRTEAGTPASRVRVSATTSPGAASVGLAETDEMGRFVLPDIPPGRYYIVAGRVGLPTVYPGTQEIEKGTTLAVAPGMTISGIDFVIAESSYRTSSPMNSAPRVIQMTLPVTVTVEGGGAVPASTTIRLTPVAGGKSLEAPLTSTGIVMPVTLGTIEDYRISIDNLPDGYVVKAMTFGSTDLTTETLKASAASLATPFGVPRIIVTFTGEGELQRIVDRITEGWTGVRRLSITLAPRARP